MKKITNHRLYAHAYVKAATVATSVTAIIMITGAGRKFR